MVSRTAEGFLGEFLTERSYEAEAKHLATSAYYPLRPIRATSTAEAERKLRERDCLSETAWELVVVPQV